MTDKTKMTCPKCSGPMRTHARNGITIEQCTTCHGIFLDRGELELLISAESSYLGGTPDESRPNSPRGFLGELFE